MRQHLADAPGVGRRAEVERGVIQAASEPTERGFSSLEDDQGVSVCCHGNLSSFTEHRSILYQ
jgi:hypothetical protein